MFGLPGWVACGVLPFGGKIWYYEIKLILSHCCTCHKESLLGYRLAPPSPFSGTIPSLRPPARELLGNQNQLLVLSPLSPFWLCINSGVVFSESSLWTLRPTLWPWHHHAMENLSHFLLFLQFYCSTDGRDRCGDVHGMSHTRLSNSRVFHHLSHLCMGGKQRRKRNTVRKGKMRLKNWGGGEDLLQEVTWYLAAFKKDISV